MGRRALILAGCLAAACNGGGGEKEPIRVGLLAPMTGNAAFVGESFERVAETAVLSINENGGVDGHPLVLVVADTQSDPVAATDQMRELIEVEGVVAIVGPALSDNVAEVYAIARDAQVPFISPSSTAASLIEADDGGFMFRNVPNDNLQGLAQACYLAVDPDGPGITSVSVLHENGEYGEGLASSFEAAFEAACATCDVPDSHVIGFDKGLDEAQAESKIAELAALSPTPRWIMTVAVAEDGVKLMNAWDPPSESPVIQGAQWFLTDGARVAGFLENIPSSMRGMLGTAPTVPISGDAYGVLVTAYDERNNDDVGEQVFAANVWDAYHLIGAGLAYQMYQGAETYGGAGLRDAIDEISHGPGQIFHAGQWPDLVRAIVSGAEVDYDGASGPNDFDEDGETLGPYEIWSIADDGSGGFTFVQVQFLEAGAISTCISGS